MGELIDFPFASRREAASVGAPDTVFTSQDGHTWVVAALPFEETLAEVLAAWRRHGLAAGHSGRTISSRAYTVQRLAASGVDPLTADREALTAWLAALTDGRTGADAKKSSRATYQAQIRAFYVWLQDCGRRDDNPSAKLPQPRTPRAVPRPLSEASVEAVLAACADPRARQTRAYVILACYAGLRVHEIAKMRGEHVDGDDLRVEGKGGSDCTIPLHPRIAELATTMPPQGWWFPTHSESGHVHRCSVSSAIARALKRAGVRGTPHACRHFYGTQVLAAAGGNMRVAQQALRHADIRSTAIYTQIAGDDLRRAITGIPSQRPAA